MTIKWNKKVNLPNYIKCILLEMGNIFSYLYICIVWEWWVVCCGFLVIGWWVVLLALWKWKWEWWWVRLVRIYAATVSATDYGGYDWPNPAVYFESLLASRHVHHLLPPTATPSNSPSILPLWVFTRVLSSPSLWSLKFKDFEASSTFIVNYTKLSCHIFDVFDNNKIKSEFKLIL